MIGRLKTKHKPYLVKERDKDFSSQWIPGLLLALLTLLKVLGRNQMPKVLQLHLPILLHTIQGMNEIGLDVTVLGGPDENFRMERLDHDRQKCK